MKKVCIIIPSLGNGGAERVAFHLLNNLDMNKYELSFITVYNDSGNYIKDLRNGIVHISLKKDKIRNSIFAIYKTLKILKPDIVMVFSFELMILIGIFIIPFFKNIYFINRQINIISKLKFGKLKSYLLRKSIKNYDKIITQSQDMTEDLLCNIKINREKIVEINNPIDTTLIERLSNENIPIELKKEDRNLICVGRLEKQKGFDLIIEIMGRIEDHHIKLYILGDGSERIKLEKMIIEKHLENRVFLLGRKENPYVYMKNADLFILSSRYEGFPNVLIEANACGTYAICNNCPGGINEIIKEGINGSIVDFYNPNEVIQSMLEKLNDINTEKDVIKKTVSEYSLKNIIKRYENALGEKE